MSGSRSNYLEAKVLDSLLGGVSYAPLATHYIALFTTMPSDTSPGTEPIVGGYARCPVTNNLTNWPAATEGDPTTKSNGTLIEFTPCTSDWGVIVAVGIMDQLAGGNMLYWSDLTVSKSVVTGDIVRILSGGILISAD